jgi:DNA repair protein RecO (recombination protein O)
MSERVRVHLESAFVLRTRAYRETSQILEVLSWQFGRVGLVARGARGPRSKWRGLLSPFQPLRMSWSGHGALYTLTGAETSANEVAVQGVRLMAGFYLNELILNFLQRGDPHPDLFTHYAAALAELADAGDVEVALRRFELSLLSEVGYGLVLDHEANGGRPLVPGRRYEYIVTEGPVLVSNERTGDMIFPGSELIAIAHSRFTDAAQRRSAKKLLRAVLDYHLGGRPLKTRQVLSSMYR